MRTCQAANQAGQVAMTVDKHSRGLRARLMTSGTKFMGVTLWVGKDLEDRMSLSEVDKNKFIA